MKICGSQVSPNPVSTITDEIPAELAQRQQRLLEAMCPIVYLDALRLNIRDEERVGNEAAYPVSGIRACGKKKVPRLRIEQTAGAR